MKMLYVANARIPTEKAHGLQIMNMCEAFAGSRVEITLILPFRFQTSRSLRKIKDVWDYYGLATSFKIVKLPCLDLLWLDSYLRWLPFHPPFLLQAFSFAFVAALYTLYRKADVYYTRDRYFAFFFSSLKFWHRRKIYYEAHTAGALEKWLMKKDTIDGLVVISNALKEVYIKQGVAREKVLVAPDGVGMKAFAALDAREQARRVLGMPLDRKIICYTGHLYGWKGVDILARSMHYLPPSYIAYLVGGTEEDVMRFREFILQENLTNVVMLGHVAPTLIPGYLAASDVLVLPNVGEGLSRYTSPLKLFEYMAAKRPIVASDLPAIREILNEETAVLVAPGDPQALAEGVQKVISDQELARRIAERAYRDVQQYAWERRAEKIFEFMLSKKR